MRMKCIINLFLICMFLFNNNILAVNKKIFNVINKKAEEYKGELITLRRHLHMYPELSSREYKTAEYIASILERH